MDTETSNLNSQPHSKHAQEIYNYHLCFKQSLKWQKTWSLHIRNKLIQTVWYAQTFHDYVGTVKV